MQVAGKIIGDATSAMSDEEKNALKVLYKSLLQARRVAGELRVFGGAHNEDKEGVEKVKAAAARHAAIIETELKEQNVTQAASKLRDAASTAPALADNPSQRLPIIMFFYKIEAEYHSFAYEVLSEGSEMRSIAAGRARTAYDKAIEIAKEAGVSSDDVLLVCVVHSYCLFLGDVINEKQEATKIGVSVLGLTNEMVFSGMESDVSRIKKFLIERVDRWTAPSEGEGKEEGEDKKTKDEKNGKATPSASAADANDSEKSEI